MGQGPHPVDPLPADFGGEHRTEALPPEPDRLVADVDPALVQQILDVPQGQREPDVHHHRQTDTCLIQNSGSGLLEATARHVIYGGQWRRLDRDDLGQVDRSRV